MKYIAVIMIAVLTFAAEEDSYVSINPLPTGECYILAFALNYKTLVGWSLRRRRA